MSIVGLNSLLLQVFYGLSNSDYILEKDKASASSSTQNICAYLPTYSHYQKNPLKPNCPQNFIHKEKINITFTATVLLGTLGQTGQAAVKSQGSVLKEDSIHRE